MKEIIKKHIFILAIIPLLIGTIGYMRVGIMFSNALYSSFALYFTNPISDAYNIYIEIARWTAPLVTATTILYVIKDVWSSINCRISTFNRNDSVAVYSDENCNISVGKGTRVIYPGNKFKSYTNSCIILFSDDKKNLKFYEEHKNKLNSKNVYIGIKDIDSSFLKIIDNVYFFDINMAISRILWKKVSLWNNDKIPVNYNIIVYGDSNLSKSIISAGLQLNLVSLNQSINYYIITDNDLIKIRYSEVDLMNNDKLIFCQKTESNIWDNISNANLVIITEDIKPELLQTIVEKVKETPVYYYSPNETDLVSYISSDNYNLKVFGRKKEIFTDDNIRRQKLIQKAIDLNNSYVRDYKIGDSWEKLSGFLKASNISASDFGEVLSRIKSKMTEDEMANLEHIRWCRFHFINYYKFGIPDNNKNRDDKKKIHKSLVDYNKLSSEVQDKDKKGIRITMGLYE